VTCGCQASECWGRRHLHQRELTSPRTLIERWDGTSWAIVSSPNHQHYGSELPHRVRARRHRTAGAVGYYYNGQRHSDPDRALGRNLVGHRQFAQHQHHAAQLPLWRDVRVGIGLLGRRHLLQRPSAYQTLIERWEGTSWAIVSFAQYRRHGQQLLLRGVTCVSASECWAVGYLLPTDILPVQTLIERWDGNSWPSLSRPTPAPRRHNLYGVTCVFGIGLLAVGNYYNESSIAQTLIERWDGTSWAIVSSPPNTSTDAGQRPLWSDLVSASECWAVGYYYTGNFIAQTLIERWEGTSWAIVSSPTPARRSPTSSKRDVACRRRKVLGRGAYNASFGVDLTLVLRVTRRAQHRHPPLQRRQRQRQRPHHSNSNGDTDTNRDATAYANAKGSTDPVPTADASLTG